MLDYIVFAVAIVASAASVRLHYHYRFPAAPKPSIQDLMDGKTIGEESVLERRVRQDKADFWGTAAIGCLILLALTFLLLSAKIGR